MLSPLIEQIFRQALRHHQAGELTQAEALYRQVLAADGAHCDSLNLLGVLIFSRDKEAGLELIQRALAANPRNANACFNLGNALKDLRRFDKAIAAYRDAVALNPRDFEALTNAGTVFLELRRLDDAMAAWRQAIALNPSFAAPYGNMSAASLKRGLTQEALTLSQQAVFLTPNAAEAHVNLGNALKEVGRLDESIAAFRKALSIKPDLVAVHDGMLLALHYLPGIDGATLAEEHQLWKLRHAAALEASIPAHANDADPDRPLRIGYVSADFCNHSVGRFMLPLFSQHDKQQYQLFVYSSVETADEMTQLLRCHAHGWREVRDALDTAVAALILKDRIDVLVDLSMHSGGNRLLVFARKPAPVQVTYLAYGSTSGLDTMDYRLSDPYLDPPGAETFYSEQTVLLPESYWCFEPLSMTPKIQPPPALAQGYVTFGCLNNFCKVNRKTLDCWARLLCEVPGSRLLLHAPEGAHRGDVVRRLGGAGVAPERIAFYPKVSTRRYFELYQGIDIALDTFPFAGGTTTCDALWMGVPVVTLKCKFAFGRSGVSLLSNLGLREFIANSEEDYVRIAASLARDLPWLRGLRATLRHRMEQSPLMDAPRFARNVEAAYRQVWREWCAKSPRLPL